MWNAKEQRMIYMNIFRTLCDFYKGGQLLAEDIRKMTFVEVNEVIKK